MKKIYLLIATVFALSTFKAEIGYSQFCNPGTLVTDLTSSFTSAFQNAAVQSAGRPYWTFTGVAGTTYSFSTCTSSGDTYLRLYSGVGVTLLSQNDDNGPYCAVSSGPASLDWVCPTSGTYSILLTRYVNSGNPCGVLNSSITLQYKYIIPAYRATFTALDLTAGGTRPALAWCAGETRNVLVTVQNTGTAAWTSGATGVNLSYWFTPGQNRDFNGHLQPFSNLVSGASKTVSIPITAPVSGPLVLNFDLVKETFCWFADNSPGCSGPGNSIFQSGSITINALPTITGAASVCTGSTTSLTGSGTAATTNPWTSSNTAIATVSTTGVVTGVAAGGPVTITYTNNNGCSKTASITVNPLPTITGATSVCIGSTTPLTGSGTAATTNPWTSSNTAVATVSTTGVVTGVAAGGPVTITYTNNNGCSITTSITVNALPTITGAASVCTGSTTSLTGSGTAATTNPWTSSNTAIATVSTTGVVTGVAAGGPVTITYTNNNGCSKTASITVNPLPTITGATSVCIGSTTPLTGSGTAATTNPWTSSNTAVATVSTTGVVTGVAAGGPVTITYTNNNGCSITTSITVNALPTITGAASVCTGSTTSLTGSGTAATTNPWTSSNTAIATVSTTGVVTGVAAGGPVTITYTNNNGCSKTASITVNPNPTVNAGGAIAAICQSGTTTALGGSFGGGATSAIWSDGSAGGTFANNTGSTPNTATYTASPTSTSPVTLTLTTSGGSCGTTSDSKTLTVYQSVAITTDPGPAIQVKCATQNVSYSVVATGSGLTYQWLKDGNPMSNGGRISGVLTSTLNITGLTIVDDGDYSVIVSGAAPCGSVTSAIAHLDVNQSILFTKQPLTPQTLCEGQTYTIFATTTGTVTTYQWLKNGSPYALGNFDGVNTYTLTIPNITSATNGSYRLLLDDGSGSGCSAANSNIAVLTVNPTPTATISGTNTVCQSSSPAPLVTFTNPQPLPVTITYNINTGANLTINVAANTDATVAAPTGIAGVFDYNLISVAYQGATPCSTPLTGSATVTVSPTPDAIATPSSQQVCSGDPITTIVLSGGVAGTTFTWTRNNPAVTGIPASGSGDISGTLTNSTTAPITVTFTIIPTANTCVGTPITATVTVNPTPLLTSSLTPPARCSNVSATYTATSATPSTYSWTRAAVAGISNAAGSGSTNLITETLINTTIAPINVIYSITLTANGCSNTQNVTVTINPSPVLTSSLTAPARCSNVSTTYIATTATSPSTFTWSRAAVAGITPNTGSGGSASIVETLINSTANPISVTYAITILSSGCSNTQNVTATVNPNPTLTSSLTPPALCNNTVFNYNPTSATSPITFNWSRAVVAGISNPAASGTNNPGETLINTTTAPVSVTYVYTLSANSCSNTQNVVVVVNPTPTLTSSLTPSARCSNISTTYTATSATASTYTWTRAAVVGISNAAGSGSGANITETLINTTTGPVNVVYAITLTANTCSNTQNVTVTINPSPVLTSSLTAPARCSNVSTTYIATTATSPSTFTWSRAAVAGITPNTGSGGSASIVETLINSTANPISVTYAITILSSGCSNTQNVTATVNPNPTLTSSLTPPALCNNTVFNYNPTSATSPITFNWSRAVVAGISNPAASGTNNPGETLINTTTAPVSVTYVYTLSANSCSNTQNVVVVVNPTPTLTSSLTPSARCSNISTTYTATSATASTYTWTRAAVVGISNAAGSGSGANITETLINTTGAPLSVVYAITQTANSCSNVQNVTIIINPAPAVANTFSSPVYCTGAAGAAVTFTSNVATSVTYAWTSTVDVGFGTSGNGNIPVYTATNTGSTSLVATVTVIASANGCSGAPGTYTVTVNPAAPVPTSPQNLTICQGGSGTISVTAAAGAPGTTTLTFNISSNPSETNSAPGNVVASATYAALPAGAVVTGATLTVPNIKPVNNIFGASQQNDVNLGFSGAIVNAAAPSPTAGTGSSNFTYTRTIPSAAINTAGGTVNLLYWDAFDDNIFSNDASFNPPNAGTLVINYTLPLTVSWYNQATGGTLQGTGNPFNPSPTPVLPNTNTAGVYNFYAEATSTFGCLSNSRTLATVTINTIPSVTAAPAAQPVCSGSAITPIVISNPNAVAGTTYSWTRDNGTLTTGNLTGVAASGSGATINGTFINTTTSVQTTTFTITASALTCTSTTTVSVTVNPKPGVTNVATKTICSGTSTNISLTSTVPSSFSWTVGTISGSITGATAGSGSIINQVLTNPSNLLSGSVQYIVTPTATTGSCAGDPFTITVTINPAPVVTTTSSKTICSGTSTNISLTGSVASTYTWTIGTITGGITGASAGTGSTINQILTNPSNLSSGSVQYIVTPTATTGTCVGAPYIITVTVNPAPLVTNASTASTCSGTGPNITLTSSIPSAFTWTIGTITGSITGASSGSGPTINQILSNPSNSGIGTVQYIVTPTSNTGSCGGAPFTITVTVNPSPVVTTASTKTICSGTATNISLTSSTPGTFAWTIGTVTGGITGATSSSGTTINQTLTNPSNSLSGSVQYIVTATSTTGTCAGTPFTITVTVNPAPAVTNAPGKTICSGSATGVALTSSVAGTFTWTIGTITGSITGATAGSGSTINQVLTNPSNLSAGTVDYIITPTATTGSCIGTPFTITVTVNPLPAAIITGSTSICVGLTTTLSPTTGGTWVSNNSGVATVDNSGLVTGVSAGTATFTFTITATGCSNTTPAVTVNALPIVAPITDGATSICVNGITNFNDATTGGVWSVTPGTGTASIDNTGLLTGLSAGSVTVVYTVTNSNGCIKSVTAPLTIDALPAISPIAGGSATVCENGTTPAFTDATPGGIWSIIDGTGTASITSGGIVTGLTAGTVTVLYTTTNGTCSNEAGKALTVKPAPVVAAIGGGASSVCVTQSTPAFTNATSGGVWSIINGTGTASITIGGVATGLTAGLVTVAYTVTGGGCSSIATKPLTVNSQTTLQPIAGGASSICLNSATPAFTNSTAGGVWSIINGTGTAVITAGGVATGTGAGSVTVVYTYSNGSCSDFVTIPLNVKPLPVSAAITGASGVCAGSTINLISNATGTGTLTYTWSSSNTTFATVDNAGLLTGVAAGVANITYTVTDGNGCSSTSPAYPVTVSKRPTANITLANTSICNGSSINITGNVTASGAWTITLSNGATATGTGNGTFSIAVTPTINTTYTITSLSDAGCSSNPGDLTGSVTITVNDPVAITTQPANVAVCATFAADLTISASGSGITYQWYKGTAPTGILVSNSANITGATTNNLHFNSAGASDDADYYVIVSGIPPCAPLTSNSAHLSVSTTITISAQPASQTVCVGSDVTFSVTASTAVGPLLYQWRKNGTNILGAVLSTYTITGTTVPDAANYDVVITGIGGCGTAFSAVATLTINPLSVGGTVNTSAAVCSGSNTGTINLTGQTGSVINWESSPDGTTWTTVAPANTSTSLTYTNLISTTYYRAVVQSGVCLSANSVAAKITVNPIPNAIATPSSQTICSAGSITTIVLSSGVGTTTYAWTRDNTASVTGIAATGSGNISGTLTNTTAAPVTVTFTITPTANSCQGTAITATVIVNPAPNVVATPSTQTICGGLISTIVITGNTGSTTFNWSRDKTGTVTGIAASGSGDISGSLTNTTNAAILVTFTITPSANGCPGTPITATVNVKPTPTVSATPTSQTVCSGIAITQINITNPNNIPGTTYALSRDNTTNLTGIAATGTGNIIAGTLTNTTSVQQVTTFTIVATANGCSSTTTVTVTVNPKPVMTSAAAVPVCNKSTVGLALTSTVTSTYTWQATTPNGNVTGESTTLQSGNTLSDFLTNTSATGPSTPRQNVIYTVIPTSAQGCIGSAQAVTVRVNPPYNVSFYEYPSDDNSFTVCDGNSVGGGGENDIDLIEGDYSGSTLLWQYSLGSTSGPWNSMVGPHSNNMVHDTLPDPPSIFSPQGNYYFRLLVDGCFSDTLSLIKSSTLTVNAGPDNTICESASPSPITLSGSSVNGTASTTVGGIWTITSLTPANGGNNGTLSNNGFISTASGNIPNVTYTPPANYAGTVIITLTTNDPDGPPSFFFLNPCVPITDTRVITLTQAPIISNPSVMTLCSGTGTNITLTSAIPSTFTWTVAAITGGITGTTVGSSGSGPTINQVLTNPSNTATGTVKYNITPIPNSPSGCAAITSSITVTVTPSPAVSLVSSASTICQGNTPTLTATNSGGTLSRTLSGTSGTINYPILDNNTTGVSSTIPLSGSGGLTLVPTDVIKVTLNINHTFDADLDIFLVDPSGTRAMLLSMDNGGNDDNYTNTILRTDVSNVIGSGGNNAGPFNGTYRPEGTISTAPAGYLGIPNTALSGASIDGGWTLRVFDDANGDIGTLLDWSLSITRATPYTSIFSGPATIGTISYSGTNNTIATAVITPPPGTDTYVATTTDATGCVGTSAPVAVIVNPTLTLTGATTSAVCAGSSATINLTGLVPNSTSVITYKIGTGSNQTASVTAVGTTGSFNTGILTLANNGQTLLISGIAYATTPNCSQPLNISVPLVVNASPTLTGAAQQAAVCPGSPAQINLTGLVANSTSTVTYTIGGGPAQNVTGVVANSSGTGSFSSIPLIFANNGQTLQITGITITSATPGCTGVFTQNVTLSVNPTPILSSTLAPPPVCSGSTFTYSPASGTSGATFTWTRAAVTGITPVSSSGSGSIIEVLTNTSGSPKMVMYVYITTANGCSNAPAGDTVKVSVNPSPTIATASQAAASCAGSGAVINITGLLPGTTSTIYYVINNVAQTPVTGVVSNGSGAATFITPNLTLADDGQILKITGISNTVFTPSCIKSVTVIALLKVTAVPTLAGVSQAAPVCVSSSAIINLTGMVANDTNNIISYTINGIAQTPVSGVNADASGNASFNTGTLTPANNGQTLTITSITSGACSQTFSKSLTLNVSSSYVWLGVNNNWFDVQNWCGGVPTITSNVLIPSSLLNYPILMTGIAYANDLTIQSGASVTITGATFTSKGAIFNSGTFDVSNGKIELNGSVGQTITAGTFMNNKVQDIVITNTAGVTLSGPVDVYRSLTYGANNAKLATGGFLTLKSTATETAWIGDMTNHTINGNVTVERYIGTGGHPKSWQLLAVPTTSTQTIKQAWQEGASAVTGPGPYPNAANPKPGFGTMLTSNLLNAVALGFDVYTAPGPSIKFYNYVTDTYTGPASTSTTPIYNQKGYFVLVRGDRSVYTVNGTANPTILRTTGTLFTPANLPPSTTVFANKFESVGNPYASALDLRSIANTAQDFFIVWDPKLGGAYGLGGFVTLTRSGSNYIAVPQSPTYGAGAHNFIQSGQAFIVQAFGSNGTISFKEADKANGSLLVNRPMSPVIQSELRTNLFGVNADGTSFMTDGILNQFDDSYSNSVDGLDARKAFNGSENVSIKSAGTLLAIERRHTITQQDTIFLNLTGERAQPYRFEFIASNLNTNGLEGFVEDNYLHTRTPLNLSGTTSFDFTVANIAGSYAPDRFRIVFASLKALPVTFTSVKAYRQDKNINVEWKVDNEMNIKNYTVEKSADGIHFNTLLVKDATANGGRSATYLTADAQPLTGYNYYRIRSNDLNDKTSLTQVVKVFMGTIKQDITIYPNPITDGMIHLQLMNQPEGKYKIRLLNKIGQVILTKQVEHADGSSTELIKWDFNLAHGMYQLEVTKPNTDVKNINVMY